MRNYRGQNSATHTPKVCVSVCKYIYLFAVITLVRVIVRKDFARFDVALELFVLALLPFLLEKLFSCRVSKAMFLYIELYLIGYPLLCKLPGMKFFREFTEKLEG